MEKFKNWVLSVISSSPLATGWLAFMVALSITLFLSFVEYQLKLANERERVNSKLNELENQISLALNNGISATKTLAFIAQNENDLIKRFDEFAPQILQANPSVDIIQYLDSGTIVAVYPRPGNESVVGYNVMKDSTRNIELIEAIKRKDVFFSGPLQLRQGGFGIVGRYPIFQQDTLTGFAAVIILFEKLLNQAGLENSPESDFRIEMIKANPETGILENFIPSPNSTLATGYKASVLIPIGNWNLTVQLKKSTAFSSSILAICLRILASGILGFLAWSFARQPSLLRKKLKEQSDEIMLANERFEFATKATSDVIWDWDLQSDQVYRSSQLTKMLGYTEDQSIASSQFWKSIIHPDDAPKVNSDIIEALESESPYWEEEFRVRKSDGSYAYIIDKGYIIRDGKGKPMRMIGAIQDISKRKTAELELLNANESLKNANEELKVFASLASHDMREPLRMISSFMLLLQKKYEHLLDEKANQYISFAIDGSKRLTNLINDLLEYSKVGFDSSSIETIPIHAVIEEVLALKSDLIRESGATVLVEPLPDIKGIKTPIQIVFQNLIGNALKYRKEGVKPIIKISGRELKDFWEFSIEDNGIGIEAEYLEQIFGIFKRLHPKEKYSGTGMGLATCKKIVNQHGGNIWAESLPESGSKFLFTIKKYG